MKKSLFVFFFILSSFFATAQTEKGDQTVSGLFSMRLLSQGGGLLGSYDGIYQYFIFKNVSVGAGLEFNFDRIHSNELVYHNRSYFFMPEARYYFLHGKFNAYTFANAGFGYNYHSGDYQSSGFAPVKMQAGLGASWFFSNHLALEARVGLRSYIPKSSKPVLDGFDFRIGLQYSIPSSKKKLAQKQD